MAKVRCVWAAAGRCDDTACCEYDEHESRGACHIEWRSVCQITGHGYFCVSVRRKVKPTCGNCGHFDGRCNVRLPRCIDVFRRHPISKKTNAEHCHPWIPSKEIGK